MAGRRPEYSNPPEQFYNEEEAKKYTSNSRMVKIQAELAERAYELLELDDEEPRMLLDIGCGSGLSGEILTEYGHEWIGVDISEHMLKVAKDDNETSGDLICMDIGLGLPFKPGCFDGAFSISAIQWLCHSNTSEENPQRRLHEFFQSLYSCLARGARAVFQFYPENKDQCDLICQQALKAGFRGGLVVDYPESTKAKKIFLVINAGGNIPVAPKPLTNMEESGKNQIQNIDRASHRQHGNKQKKPQKGTRAFIEANKDRLRRRGKDVRASSKYTGRKRH